MRGVCCRGRKMMGGTAEGGCGTEETPCAASRASAKNQASTPVRQSEEVEYCGIGLLEQAQKSLSERSPFDAEDSSAPVNPVLPASLAHFCPKPSDLRKRHKKSNSDGISAGASIWEETEEYFREVTTDDIQRLHDLYSLSSFESSKYLTVPLPNESHSLATNNGVEKEHSPGLDTPSEEKASSSSSYPVERILASRNRYIRKGKVREECGLERVLEFCPAERNSTICHLCCLSGTEVNRLLNCRACHVVVHQKCHGSQTDEGSSWICSWCKHLSDFGETHSSKEMLRPCVLCPKLGGELKPIQSPDGLLKFVHLFCTLWMPEVYIEDTSIMEPVINVDSVDDGRRKLLCSICKVHYGSCVKCSHGVCRISFHPLCAREAGHKMEIWCNSSCTNVELQAFCSKHSGAKISHASGNSSVGVIRNPIPRHPSTVLSLDKHKIVENGQESGHRSDNVLTGGSINVVGNAQLEKTGLLEHDAARQPECREDHDLHAVKAPELDNQNDFLALLLKKLIDRGKVDAKNLSSEIGISTVSLDASIAHGCFAPDMRHKIIRWLEDHAYMCGSKKDPKMMTENSPSQVEPITDGGGDSVVLLDSRMFVSGEQRGMPVGDERGDSQAAQAGDAHISSLLISSQENLHCPTISEANPFSIETSAGHDVHPFIQQKITEVQSGLQGRVLSSVSASSSTDICCKEPERLINTDPNVERLDKARNMGILSFCPVDDELEGEIIFLQNKLLENAVARRHSIDILTQKLVGGLALDMDISRRLTWDSAMVNKYLTEIREAKKQSRKERKHKEAQAVLEAANALTSTCRFPSSRKESPVQERDSIEKQPTLSPRGVHSSKSSIRICDVCMQPDGVLNPVLRCSGCKVAVHLDCYHHGRVPTGPFYCESCEEGSSVRVYSTTSGTTCGTRSAKLRGVVVCVLCGFSSGAFRKSTHGQWVHAFCAEWFCEATFRRGQTEPPELEMDKFDGSILCCICNRKHGMCLKCNDGHCQAVFSPYCARARGLYVIVKAIGGTLRHKAYCEKHSKEQRAEAEVHNYSLEDMNNLKKTRVELERLRLLCERIIKREKLKKELVFCSQQVLVTKRDAIAVSPLLEGPLSLDDISLESATTSLRGGNKSSSEPFKRSDDVTIDSTTTSKIVRRSVSIETDNSSSSQRYLMKKTAGKQIPRRPLLVDSEKTKPRKAPENFDKEILMTSEQAQLKNRRLPRGYVYIPVGSLQEKDKNHETKALKPSSSDG